MRTDPSDTGGLFVTRRPGTRPIQYRTPPRPGDRRQRRRDAVVAAGLLALMALARIESIEQLRYSAPGEWGNLLGLDRIPEVRCLRRKLSWLCREQGRAAQWNAALAEEWIKGLPEGEMLFYADGHVRVYHGGLTALPRHYVPRQRLCLRAVRTAAACF